MAGKNSYHHRADKLSRRKFLKWQLQGSLYAGTAGLLGPALLTKTVLAAEVPGLAVVTGPAEAATYAAVKALGGMQNFVKKGQKVVIKPNISFANKPEEATTTNPEVVSALLKMCLEAGAAKVDIVDHVLMNTRACLENTGIKASCDAVSQGLVKTYSKASDFIETKLNTKTNLLQTDIMTPVLEADVLIAAPVAKSHSSTGVSLSMKGMMGLIYDRRSLHWRYNLHQGIVDICSRLRANLTVIDVTRALTTNGPGGPGKVVKLNKVVASRDMLAADAKVVSMVPWYGQSFKPTQIKHLRLAHEQGFGIMDYNDKTLGAVEIKL